MNFYHLMERTQRQNFQNGNGNEKEIIFHVSSNMQQRIKSMRFNRMKKNEACMLIYSVS